MRPEKTQKLDLNKDYPCPCKRKGRLLPITLTDAFGCDRCQHIFVVQDNFQIIEQLSSTYPYKRSWRWRGNRWSTVNSGWGASYFFTTILISLMVMMVVLPSILALNLSSPQSMIFWVIVALMTATLSALILWLAYRR